MVFKALLANCFTVITSLLIVSRLLCSLCSSSWLVLIPHEVGAFYNTGGKLTGEPSIRFSATRSVRVGVSGEIPEGSCTYVYKCVCTLCVYFKRGKRADRHLKLSAKLKHNFFSFQSWKVMVMGVGRSLADFLNCLYVRTPTRDLVQFLILLSKRHILSHIVSLGN